MTLMTRFCSTLIEAVTASRATVRPWRPGDMSEVNRLYNDATVRPDAAVKGYVPRTDSQWTWEFATATPDSPAYFVAEQFGRIIGIQGYIPIELLCDGRPVLSGKDEDTLVHPDQRGRGVLDALYRRLFDRAAEDDIGALWGFTSTAVQPLLRNGYLSIGKFDAMQAPLGAPSEPFTEPCPGDASAGVTIRSLLQPDERCDAFSLAFGQFAGGITLHLSSRFLRWRILDNPYRRHALFAAFHGERMVGLAVFKLDDPNKIGYVSDLVAIPTEGLAAEAILSALLREGLALFRKLGIRRAEARFSGPHPFNVQVRGVLSRWGFHSLPSTRTAEFLVRPITNRSGDWLDFKKWRICELMREY